MSTLKEDILNLKDPHQQLELEKRNLFKHLQVHENNYAATLRQHVEKVEHIIIV